jgi:hypothetical protein
MSICGSFGCLTYELVTGESLFRNGSGNTRQEEVMNKLLSEKLDTKINQLWGCIDSDL